jgi:exonuclease SbcC
MKPIILEMHAFGPFAHKQIIDFRKLGDRTFFLIHGPTGSGKTTVLDGICYALFGDSSGGERDGQQMRSHHADSETLTEVSFDFALGADRYRVKRVPEQMRKARRGDGETKQIQSADLWQIRATADGEEEAPITSGWSKVTAEIVKLLGFESRQFRQVIMLPQGKFREFLMSNTQEREKILQTLFGTEIYKRIEEALKLSAIEVAKQADTVRTQRQTLLDQAQIENEGLLEARRLQQAEDLISLQNSEREYAAAAQAAEKVLTEARLVSARFEEFDKATTAIALLNAEQPAWAIKREQLDGARQAASIHPYEVALAEVGRQLTAEAARSKTFKDDLAAATVALSTAAEALKHEKTREAETDQAVARIAQLDALGDKVASLGETRAQHRAADTQNAHVASALQKAQDAFKAATDELQRMVSQIQTYKVQAAEIEGLSGTQLRLTTQLEQASTLVERHRTRVVLAAQVTAGESALKAAEALAASARQQRDGTRQAWIAGQAARLTHELIDGAPCPVCGATDHPAPAVADGTLVLDETMKAAEDLFASTEVEQRRAEAKLVTSQGELAVLDARIGEITIALGDAATVPLDQLKSQTETAQAALAKAKAAAEQMTLLEKRVPAAEQLVQDATATAKDAETAAQLSREKLQQLLVQLKEREADIPTDLADMKALQAAKVVAEKLRDSLKKALDDATTAMSKAEGSVAGLKAHLESSEQATGQLTKLQQEKGLDLDQRIEAAGFANIDAYRSAWRDDAVITEVDFNLRTFEASLLAARERQLRATDATKDLVRPDIPGLSASHEEAKGMLLGASNAVRDIMAALKLTSDYVQSLTQMAASYQALEERYSLLKEVSDVASGQNIQRMSFQRYVLATLLEEVLATTSIRLRVMSRGRYEIRRRIDPVDQRAAAGLDLEIFDQYTGTTRGVSTLSGGESFLASLALALGLSDVVQSYAGGIRLDAIFVDEGFGTLDPEALDFAIRALKDLQQAGRMVGIISHVAELKEWIDARLELKATQTGSVANFVG